MGTVMQEVALNDVRFFSPIGYYVEERILGNEFFVDLTVAFPFLDQGADELANTLNYEGLYQILCQVMRQERKLLESAAAEVLQAVREQYAFAEHIDISIRKTTPPFGTDQAHTRVSLSFRK